MANSQDSVIIDFLEKYLIFSQTNYATVSFTLRSTYPENMDQIEF